MISDQFLGTDEFNYEQYEYILDNCADLEPDKLAELATQMMANIRNDKNVAHSKLMLSLIYAFIEYGSEEMEGLGHDK